MKILQLHIENFGKLRNIDFNFNDGFNQIYKENGWGKSTLIFFIKAMFYGMSAKTRGEEYKSERTRFMPWQGGLYGGNLTFESNNKIYKVTRIFDKTPEGDKFELLDKSTNEIDCNEIKPLGESLFGVGVESFSMSALFSQLNFKSKLNDSMSASLVGLDKYQDDLDKVERAIKILKDRKLKLKKEIVGKDEINNKKYILNEDKSQILYINREIDNLKKDLLKYEEENKVLKIQQNDEKEKLSNQELKYQEKVNIESKINELHKQIEEESKDKSENLKKTNTKSKTMINFGLILLALIFIFFIIVSILNLLNVFLCISLIIASFVTFIILLYVKLKKRNKNKENNNQDKIIILNSQLQQNQALAETLKNAIYPDRKNLEILNSKQVACEIEIVKLNHFIKEKEKQILEIEESCDISENFIANVLNKNSQIENKIKLLDKTILYLTKAKENVSSRFVGEINQDLSSLLSIFNIDKDKYVVDNYWNVLEQSAIGMKSFEFSSQGYKDILSFCQRIVLIKKIYQKEKPFLLLDDIFVNLDDEMLTFAKKLLLDIAKNYQIIYICCNDRCKII